MEKRHVKKEAHKMPKPMMKPATDIHAYVLSAIVVIFLIIMIVNLAQTFSISKAFKPKEVLKFEATLLSDVNCKDCTDLSPLMTLIEQNGELTSVELDKSSAEAQDLIKKYGITALPNIVITGDIKKSPALKEDLAELGAVEKDGALVLTQVPPPYFDLKAGKLRGLVSLTIIEDSTCMECFDFTGTVTQLKQIMKVKGSRTIDAASSEGKQLIGKYKITALPTLLLSEDARLYSVIAQSWESVGTVESDGTHVMREIPPPYKDLSTGAIKGLVKITFLTDKSCTECYNVSMHKQALEALGISKFSEEKYVDISSTEGKALVEKYKITAAPTIVLTGDLESFAQLDQVWPSVGTIESDGAHVFRNMAAINGAVYKNLTTNAVVG